LLHLLLLSTLIFAPILFGILVFFLPNWETRKPAIVASAIVTIIAGVLTAFSGSHQYHLGSLNHIISFSLEIFVVAVILFIGFKTKSFFLSLMAIAQLGLVLYGKYFPREEMVGGAQFIIDPLSIILVLVISVIGSLIVIYAIGYMEKHDHHAPSTAASNGRFFFFLIAFLGFMNGLVLANDLTWFSLFWELTTLCSFMLISHDGTEIANKNALNAITINMLGGLGLTIASVIAITQGYGESLSSIMSAGAIIPIAFLSFAALTKSAQMPFQSWLLGAMVAPTPVSALLHSSTMVKAGSYLILRMAPAFGGTKLALILAIAGAFTFAVTSALAIGQSNGKKVLAYSTIANLGLIVACAGIGTPLAYAAGVMILCFHAISKALLFLCVGNIEQEIGSRDIEDMMGIMKKIPATTIFAVIGMVSMLVPPFGMLISKWMAIEASVASPIVLVLLVIGSALTVVFWSKWIGRIVTVPHVKLKMESFSPSMLFAMASLAFGVIVAGFVALPVYQGYIVPMVYKVFSNSSFGFSDWEILKTVGEFMEWPLFILLALVATAIILSIKEVKDAHIKAPFMCGENFEDDESTYTFKSVMDNPQKAKLNSYYFTEVFGEEQVNRWANPIALAIILILFGIIWK